MLRSILVALFVAVALASQQGTRLQELEVAEEIFAGPLTVLAENSISYQGVQYNFGFLEGPLYHGDGYVLFTDILWEDETGNRCGMIYKYHMGDDIVTPWLKCSGLVGPGPDPVDLTERRQAGANGLAWGWDGHGDLLVCQHGKQRIVRFNVDDVVDMTIDADKVTVIAETFGGLQLNSPNDLFLEGNDLYFTDPPFGLRHKDDVAQEMFNRAPQPTAGVYKLKGGPDGELLRLAGYDYPALGQIWQTVNGIAVTASDNLFLGITSPDAIVQRLDVWADKGEGDLTQLPLLYSVDPCPGATFGRSVDSMAYDRDQNVIYASSPGGITIFGGSSLTNLGFLRLDDIVANVGPGGGYIWITANKRFLRIRTIDGPPIEDDSDSSTGHLAVAFGVVFASLLSSLLSFF